VYHVSSFIGFGQLWINYAFGFAEETRFLICFAYLVIGLANIVFINGYLGSRDKKILWTTSFLCCITIPSILISFTAVSLYVNKIAISLPPLPLISPEAIAVTLVLCGIILGASLILSSFLPNFRNSSVSTKRKEVKNK
jgi:hypothetical protein